MNNFYLPEEFIVIGAAINLHKNEVTAEEVNTFQNKLSKAGVKFEHSDTPFKFVVEKDNKFSVADFPKLDPRFIQFLTSLK